MKHYEIYRKKYRKCNKIYHGLRLRSIMRVFNYIYRNNEIIYEETLNRWCGVMKKDEKTVREEFIEYAKEHGIEIKPIPNKDHNTFEKVILGYDLSPITMGLCDNTYFHTFTLFGGLDEIKS